MNNPVVIFLNCYLGFLHLPVILKTGYVQGLVFFLHIPIGILKVSFVFVPIENAPPRPPGALFGLISEVMCDTLDTWWSVSATLLKHFQCPLLMPVPTEGTHSLVYPSNIPFLWSPHPPQWTCE